MKEPGHCVCVPVSGVQMNFGAIERNALTDAVCEEMLRRFQDGGCDARWRKDDIYKFIWKKVIVNSTVNTVCYVLRLKIGEVEAHPAGQKLFRDVIREACAVATARGTPLDADEFIEHDHIDVVTNVGDYYPSMCQDAFNKRQTEIDVLNGKIAEYGRELGIPTPTCDVLSTIVRCIQDNYDRQF
jgi:2-dehydropantoate 2-reductase